MRRLIIFLILAWPGFLFSQDAISVFDNHTGLKEGVYTSLPEIMENSPKYYNCQFESKINFWFGKTSEYYVDTSGIRHEFKDSILMVVEDGDKYVKYKNGFCRLIRTGAISTFMIDNTIVYSNGYQNTQTSLLFWDVLTGKMGKLTITSMDEIFKRDNYIYSVYSGLSGSEKKQALFSYVLQYNEHNPIYLHIE
ncbi:MAG: hypothetical protein WCR72_15790 [Bacteroidota bacterium]